MNATGLGNAQHVEDQVTSLAVAVMGEVLRKDLKTRLRKYAQRAEEQESVLLVMEQGILRNKWLEEQYAL